MNESNQTCENENDLRMYQHRIYAIIYLIILIPGLIGNVLALWVFRVYVKETKKAVIFMINLAVADLLQVLSLPLRIYYYLSHEWTFGHFLCMFCFYLKYVNMYASIYFLACISVRRCMLLYYPLRFSLSSPRLDRGLCAAGWFLICLGCLPFPLLRRGSDEPGSDKRCFSELPMVPLSRGAGLSLVAVAELLGFLLPLTVVLACTWLTAGSLREKTAAPQDGGEKRKATKTVLSCASVFLVCFVPYHVTFPLDFLAKADWVASCALKSAILRCHPVTLCLASLNSCLDPVMYYFTTDEFKRRLSRPELPESFQLHRRISSCTAEDKTLHTELEE